jgi:hypothetical protein
MVPPRDENEGIKSIKNLNHMPDDELFEDVIELWLEYGDGLNLKEFIEIYDKYLKDKNIDVEKMSSASYVGYMIIFYSTYQDKDYR